MNKLLYTKVFLQQQGKTISDNTIAEVMPVWWQNTRQKAEGGLRLTDAGFELLKELDIEVYEIPFPLDMQLTTQVVIYLDKFIDTPYYLTKNSIFVTDEKKAVELTLFSGDIRKYGIAKAMHRSKEL